MARDWWFRKDIAWLIQSGAAGLARAAQACAGMPDADEYTKGYVAGIQTYAVMLLGSLGIAYQAGDIEPADVSVEVMRFLEGRNAT